MFGVKETHGQVVVISMAVAVGLPSEGLKERKPAELFIQAVVRLVKGPRSPTFRRVRPHRRRHLSLNTPLMKVIHFNGASFQTPVIKACGALDWEVVEATRGPTPAARGLTSQRAQTSEPWKWNPRFSARPEWQVARTCQEDTRTVASDWLWKVENMKKNRRVRGGCQKQSVCHWKLGETKTLCHI